MFIIKCNKNNFKPKVLKFKLANKALHSSFVYKRHQTKRLEEKIIAKPKRSSILEKDRKRIREELEGIFSCLDFLCFFFVSSH